MEKQVRYLRELANVNPCYFSKLRGGKKKMTMGQIIPFTFYHRK